jgi:hypothetical protein
MIYAAIFLIAIVCVSHVKQVLVKYELFGYTNGALGFDGLLAVMVIMIGLSKLFNKLYKRVVK